VMGVGLHEQLPEDPDHSLVRRTLLWIIGRLARE
jgi:hypothetical protein